MALALGELRVFRSLMADTVSLAPYQGVDQYGQAQFGAAVTYNARVEGKNTDVITTNGEEQVSRVQVYLGVVPLTVTPLDRLTLPGRFDPVSPPILSIEHCPDDRGVHHVTVFA